MVEDWEINCIVRSHLVKWWIDVKRLDIRTIGGVVYIKGELRFKGRAKLEEEDRPLAMGELEKEIKMMPGVKDLQIRLVNWIKQGDEWVELESRRG